MPFALVESVELELLIEGERNNLFQKITSKREILTKDKSSISPTSFLLGKFPVQDDGTELVFEVANYHVKLLLLCL